MIAPAASVKYWGAPSNSPAGEITTFKESVSVINITRLTILSARRRFLARKRKSFGAHKQDFMLVFP